MKQESLRGQSQHLAEGVATHLEGTPARNELLFCGASQATRLTECFYDRAERHFSIFVV